MELPRMVGSCRGISGRYSPSESFSKWKQLEMSSTRTTSGWTCLKM